jgi:hypothetical protein
MLIKLSIPRVEAGQNTSTAALRVARDDRREPTARGYRITGPPVPGVHKYGDLALQVGGVSDDTVKYGYGFCATECHRILRFEGPRIASFRILSIIFKSHSTLRNVF